MSRTVVTLALAVGLGWGLPGVVAAQVTHRTDFPVTDEPPRALAESAGALYLGGDFEYVGPYTGPLALTDPQTGALTGHIPSVEGEIHCIVPSAEGGFFIGGDFDGIDCLPLRDLVKIDSSGAVEDWDPRVEGPVHSLALDGNTLYIGGSFGFVAGQAREHLAAVDSGTATLLAWNPNAGGNWASSEVPRALHVRGDIVFIGGSFTGLGSSPPHDYLAAVDKTTGAVLPWSPAPDWVVNSVCSSADSLYVGGGFSSIAGVPRSRIAAFSLATLEIDPTWQPSFDSSVSALAMGQDTVYCGGYFDAVDGQTRICLAAVDATTGSLLPWNPDVQGSHVASLSLAGSSLYVAGEFDSVAGSPRRNAAAVEVASPAVTPWSADLAGPYSPTASTIAATAGSVALGGQFAITGAIRRQGLAAIDTVTGQVLPWTAEVEGTVLDILPSPSAIYVCGDFSTIDGVDQPILAALDPATGGFLPTFIPDLQHHPSNVYARTMVRSGGTLHVAGPLIPPPNSQGDVVLRFDEVTGAQLLPQPDLAFGLRINDLEMSSTGTAVFVAGAFYEVWVAGAAQIRNRLAQVDAATGVLLPWLAGTSGEIFEITRVDDILYVGGNFSSAAGAQRNKVAALHATTGLATPWNPDISGGGSGGGVHDIDLRGDELLLSGRFSYIGLDAFENVALVHRTTGVPAPWDPRVIPEVNVATVDASGRIHLAGEFSMVEGSPRAHVAAFDTADLDPRFIRGDANGDLDIDIADPVRILGYLFTGQSLSCATAADLNDDDLVDIADPIVCLGLLFGSTGVPLPPYPCCGEDPTPGALGCAQFGCP